MKNKTKNLLIASSILIVIGIALTAIGIGLGGFPGLKITKNGISSAASQKQYVLPKTQLEDIVNVDICLNSSADILFLPSGDEHFYLEYTLNGDFNKPDYHVENQTLTFTQEHMDSIVAMNFYLFNEEQLILYVPQNAVFSDIFIQYREECAFSGLSVAAKSMRLKNSNNELSVNQLSGEMLTLKMNDKKLIADNLDADTLSVSSNYNDCDFTNLSCEKAEILLDNSSLTLSAKSLGTLHCEAEYGDITLSLPDAASAYDYDIDLEYGMLSLPDEMQIEHLDSSHSRCRTESGKAGEIHIQAADGNVTVNSN